MEWYKNYVRQSSLSGQASISADLGLWFAVVADAGCSSLKSNTINVAVSPDAGATLPDYTISGPTSGSAGDTKTFIAQSETPQDGLNYRWTVTPGTTDAIVIGSKTDNAVATLNLMFQTIAKRQRF